MARIVDPKTKEDPRLDFVPPFLRGFWDSPMYAEFAEHNARMVPTFIALVGEIHNAGVSLMVGTDLANAYVFAGSSVHDEMEFFEQAGIPAADILRAATIVPAKFCEIDDRLGSIAPGKTASLVLLRANPLEDVSHVREIEGVFLRGRYYDRATLDVKLDNVRTGVKESNTDKPGTLALALPGKVLYRGRYVMKFQDFDAGAEDFLITETEDGYSVQAHAQPQGGPQPPALVTLHADKNRNLARAEYRILAESGTIVTYTIDADAVEAVATSKNGDKETQRFELTDGAVVSSPVSAGDIFLVANWDLEVGESRDISFAGFGFQGWRVVQTPTTLTRLPDEAFTMPSGEDITAKVHEMSFKTEMGEMTSRSWAHPSGLTVRTVMKMPFGEIRIQLASLETK
jgi:hypothetical protein